MGILDNKTALITGGARGFGRAIAHLLAREGADIAIADIGHNLPSARVGATARADQIDSTVKEVEALGRKAVGIQADVTKEADCQRMAAEAIAALGHIDILCANAGTFSFGRSWELTEDEWDVVLDVNLKGVWLTCKAVVPHMIERRYGKIVVTSSRDGLRMEPNYAHYCASKAGNIAFAKSLAIEVGPYNINVNAVCPTQMTDRSKPKPADSARHPYWDMVSGHPDTGYDEFDEASGRENLFEAGGQPDFKDVAEGVLWLVSDAAFMVTGHALPMDSGWIAKRGG
jgi:NAD(P)-dependent dehydrogenase (short-subunit alcohol dehydrogenase family)